MGVMPAFTRRMGLLMALACGATMATHGAAASDRLGPPTTPRVPTIPDTPMSREAPAPPSVPEVRSPQAPSPPAADRALPAGPSQQKALQQLDARTAVRSDSGSPLLSSVTVRSRTLARQHPETLELDRQGALVVRSELVVIDPSPQSLRRASDAGFTVGEEQVLDGLGLRIVVLVARPGMGTRAALRRLRRIDPEGTYDFNHLFLGAAAVQGPLAAHAAQPGSDAPGVRVGLIDSGVDASHPALSGVRVVVWGCRGTLHAGAHGTAVASLLAGHRSAGAGDGELFAADIYCGAPTGGSVVQLAQALSWMSQQDVGVVNISLVGPDNQLLERAIETMTRRGHVIVSAVGNDGPNSPALFPAAYDDVIGVTAVDVAGRVLPEAVRGPHARFAAPGTDLMAAKPGGGWQEVRGTSFAAPLVARLAAVHIPAPRPGATGETVELLSARAINAPGHPHGPKLLAIDNLPTMKPAEN